MSYFSYTCRVHFDVLTLPLCPPLPHLDAGDDEQDYVEDGASDPDDVF
jgi:hypothetical protein